MTAWRWRRCPSCQVVLPAGDFIWHWTDDYWEQPWTNGRGRRMCPRCCHLGETWEFRVVRESHPEPKVSKPVRAEPAPAAAEQDWPERWEQLGFDTEPEAAPVRRWSA